MYYFLRLPPQSEDYVVDWCETNYCPMDIAKLDEVLDYFYENQHDKILPHNTKDNFKFPEQEYYRCIADLTDDGSRRSNLGLRPVLQYP